MQVNVEEISPVLMEFSVEIDADVGRGRRHRLRRRCGLVRPAAVSGRGHSIDRGLGRLVAEQHGARKHYSKTYSKKYSIRLPGFHYPLPHSQSTHETDEPKSRRVKLAERDWLLK